MKLFEYQAKDIFSSAGIKIPNGILAGSIGEVEAAAKEISGRVALKAQVLSGSRGKAGLIKFAENAVGAKEKAKEIFGSGKRVLKILVEEALEIDREIYIALTLDPVKAKVLIVGSSEGGIEIEKTAKDDPEKIIRQEINPGRDLMPYAVRNVLFEIGLKGDQFKEAYKIINKLYSIYAERDAQLVEINPLVITRQGDLVAADGKIIIDDNASFRQEEYPLSEEYYEEEVEFEAAQKGIPYLKFDGDIGLMCAGAGLTNTVYDLIHDFGGSVCNYLEFGGPNYKRAVEAMELTLKGNPKVILIVTFGTIARADLIAEGIVEAINKLKPKIPIITAIRGTNEERAVAILKDNGIESLSETEEAVKRAVMISKGVKR